MNTGEFSDLIEGGIHQNFIRKRTSPQSDMPSWYAHYLDLWDIIKQSEQCADDEDIIEAQTLLKKNHKAFIALIDQWLDRKKENLSQDLEQNDKDVKEKALYVKKRFEKNLYRYALCYMILNRNILSVRKELESLIKQVPYKQQTKPVKVDHNLGFLLRRAYREKKKYSDQAKKIKRIKMLMQEIAPLYNALKTGLYSASGRSGGDCQYTAFRARIRHGEFQKAQSIIQSWPAKVKEVAMKVLALYNQNKQDLNIQNQYVLDESDLIVMMSFTNVSEQRVDSFIKKYSVPYLTYKFKSLLQQAYRLGQIGNFETLFTLYEKFLQGMAQPLASDEDIQIYEGKTLRPLEYKLSSQFPGIPDILDQSEEAAYELRALMASIRTLFD